MGWSRWARTSPVKEAPNTRQQWRRRTLPAMTVAIPMPKRTGCQVAGRRRKGTHASGKAMAGAAPLPKKMKREEPASGEYERGAGVRAFRTMLYLGEDRQMQAVQKKSDEG